MQFEAVIKP